MENYSYSSYPESGNSSPRSREVDCDNASWDGIPSNYKIRLMCSYGGQIHPRPHDNQLTYIGGDTKILAVDRNIKLFGLMQKLSLLYDSEVCFKYQLPGEDLDALISVTNDEDLEHMMLEYDRLNRVSTRPARLRLFLFPLDPPPSSAFGLGETKSERQWFVDSLNSAQIQNLEVSPAPPAPISAINPDFLFGLDKNRPPPLQEPKLQESPLAPTAPEVLPNEKYGASEVREVFGDPLVSPAEIQRQLQEFQRLQISSHEQTRAYPVEYYPQRVPEKVPSPQPAMPVTIPVGYWQERHMSTGGYSVSTAPGSEPPVYIVSAPPGVYQAPSLRPVTGQVGQAYYGVQRMVPEALREQPIYNAVLPSAVQQANIGAYPEAIGIVRSPAMAGVPVPEPGYAQVSYDGTGRHVYYTSAGGIMPQYQMVASAAAAVDVRQEGSMLIQEGKVVAKPPQPSM